MVHLNTQDFKVRFYYEFTIHGTEVDEVLAIGRAKFADYMAQPCARDFSYEIKFKAMERQNYMVDKTFDGRDV